MVLREGEDGAGAGGQQPGDAGAAAAAAAAAGAGGGAPDPWKRDFLPESMYGAKPEETFGKLADAWKGLREAESRRPQPGKTPDEYTVDTSKNEKLAPYFKNPNDQVMKIAREVAHEIGLPKDHFGSFVTKLYEKAIDAKALGPVYSAEAEAKAIGERLAPGKPFAEAKPLIEKAVNEAKGFGQVLGEQLKLGEGAKGLLAALVDEAAGVELLSGLAAAMGKDPAFNIENLRSGDTGVWTKEKLDAAVADERYSPYSPKFDKAFRAQVDEGFRQVHGN